MFRPTALVHYEHLFGRLDQGGGRVSLKPATRELEWNGQHMTKPPTYTPRLLR